eukprot:m51a1_g12806 hypothetical protein (142) ;mRNA; r:2446-2923
MAQRVLQLLGDVEKEIAWLQEHAVATGSADGVPPAVLTQVHCHALGLLASLRVAHKTARPSQPEALPRFIRAQSWGGAEGQSARDEGLAEQAGQNSHSATELAALPQLQPLRNGVPVGRASVRHPRPATMPSPLSSPRHLK